MESLFPAHRQSAFIGTNFPRRLRLSFISQLSHVFFSLAHPLAIFLGLLFCPHLRGASKSLTVQRRIVADARTGVQQIKNGDWGRLENEFSGLFRDRQISGFVEIGLGLFSSNDI